MSRCARKGHNCCNQEGYSSNVSAYTNFRLRVSCRNELNSLPEVKLCTIIHAYSVRFILHLPRTLFACLYKTNFLFLFSFRQIILISLKHWNFSNAYFECFKLFLIFNSFHNPQKWFLSRKRYFYSFINFITGVSPLTFFPCIIINKRNIYICSYSLFCLVHFNN